MRCGGDLSNFSVEIAMLVQSSQSCKLVGSIPVDDKALTVQRKISCNRSKGLKTIILASSRGVNMIVFKSLLLLHLIVLCTVNALSSTGILPTSLQLWLDISRTVISPAKVRESLPQGIFPDRVILSLENGPDSESLTLPLDSDKAMRLAKQYEKELQCSNVIFRMNLNKESSSITKSVITSVEEICGYILRVSDKDLQVCTITAVDIISNGQWVILENDRNVKNSLVCDLVHLIISFLLAQNDLPVTLGGTIQGKKKGGLGILCRTAGDVITWGSLLQSVINTSSEPFDKEESQVLLLDTNKMKAPTIDTSLVLPFDYEIWSITPGIR